MAKATTLKTLKVKVKADGTLSKKSLEEIQKLTEPNALNKLIPQIRGKDTVLIGTFIGLTVAYKNGLLDLITPLVGNIATGVEEGDLLGAAATAGLFGVAGIGIKAVFDKAEQDAKEVRREALQKDIARAEADIERVSNLLSGVAPKMGGTPVTEEERASGEAFIAQRREFIAFAQGASDKLREDGLAGLSGADIVELEFTKWGIAMGLAGATIYLLQSHTVSDIVELTPVVQ